MEMTTITSNTLATGIIHCGDCVVLLRDLPSDSVDAVITSPPYFQQREYAGTGIGMENEVDEYLDALHEGFAEVLRVTKSTGSIIYNIGDKIDKHMGTMLIPYRFAISVLESYREIRLLNDITWVKKNPTPRQFTKRLVSGTEPFFHFVKSADYYYAIDEFMNNGTQPKLHTPTKKLGSKYFDLIQKSDLTADEKVVAAESIKSVIAEVNSGEIQSFRVKIRGIHAPAFGGQPGGRQTQMEKKGFTIIKIKGRPMKKDYIQTSVETPQNNMDVKHPAVFPLRLIEEIIKLSCPKGGVVLDPYCGSGTTLLAAKNQGRQYIGIDINPEYCDLSMKRLNFG